MATEVPGELFIVDTVAPTIERPQNTENVDVPDAEDFDDDASVFTTQTVNSSSGGDIINDLTGRVGDETGVEVENKSSQNCVSSQNLRPQNATTPGTTRSPLSTESGLPTIQNHVGSTHPPSHEADETNLSYNGETCNLKWLWKLMQAPGLHTTFQAR